MRLTRIKSSKLFNDYLYNNSVMCAKQCYWIYNDINLTTRLFSQRHVIRAIKINLITSSNRSFEKNVR